MKVKSLMTLPHSETSDILKFENVTKKFGDLTAVDNLTITIPQKMIFGLLGPNGAGKTTMLRMVIGLIRPTNGKIRLFDGMLPGVLSMDLIWLPPYTFDRSSKRYHDKKPAIAKFLAATTDSLWVHCSDLYYYDIGRQQERFNLIASDSVIWSYQTIGRDRGIYTPALSSTTEIGLLLPFAPYHPVAPLNSPTGGGGDMGGRIS